MNVRTFPALDIAIDSIGRQLKNVGQEVHSNFWQGVDSPSPMLETLDVSFRAPIGPTQSQLASRTLANLPWAEDHFQERVSGIPYNPPPSSEYWPYNHGSKEFRRDEKYSHTYPERFWPKKAGSDMVVPSNKYRSINDPIPTQREITHRGIRYDYGDLSDVINLLIRDPHTRQAFLPVWFPEDTGAVHGERVPCTLGYLFMYRRGFLHCTYYIRSCDYFRHFRDDVYLAGRLAQWTMNQLIRTGVFPAVDVGFLTMHIGSLHCWYHEKKLLP